MANDDVLIVGKLEDDALRTSIDKLVEYVGGRTETMASDFKTAMDKMTGAMRDFAITQKVSVDLIKEAWKDMGASFDAMFDAEKRATGGGKGSGKATYPDNTIGALEQEIALQEKKRKEMELGSNELKDQNLLIEQQNEELKKQKSLNTWAEYRKAAKDQFGAINALSTDTIPKAQKKLQELINLQNRYRGTKAFDEKQWNRLEAAIDNVRAKLERLRKKGAVGSTGSTYDTLVDIKNLMPENSIDEIAAKMKALRQVKAQDAMETRALSDEYQRLKRRQHELMGSSVQLTKSNNYLAQSFGYIRNRIVYALTLGAISSFIKQVYEIRGQYELLERSLGVLVNSFERGSQVFNELNKMAIESPFTLMELAGGAKQLSAYNFEAKEVVDTTRRLADISAALGVPMERLVYNLGQIRAQTRLTARDARDFANAGLPIVGALAERFSNLEGKIVTTGDVYDRMTKKMVSYNDVMAVLNGMTDKGGKFFEFQAKQAETLRVQMANLTLATNNFLNEFGERNQGAISFFPKTLKAMLQEWRSINRVIKNVILSYGLLKLAQIVVLKGMTSMTWGMAATITTGNALTATITRLATAMKSLFINPWTGAFVAILAIIDAIGRARANAEALVDLNDKIREGAVESTENTNKFITNKGNVSTRQLAQENKLTAEQGEKAWEQIRQQIEQSAMSSNNLIGKLLEIDDINERVRKGFEYTEAINKATAALADLGDKEIKITRDKGWFGLFGEGLVKDLKDLKEELGGIGGQISMFTKEGKVNADLGIGFKEYAKELEVTANDIKNFLDVHKIKDPLQIQEILSRVKEIIKQKNPEIKGELATLFDVTLDQRVNFLTNGAIDNNASLWAMFMERLKHNSSATFQGITNDWVKNSDKLSKEQQDAIDENLEYFKKTMPFYYDTIKSMVDDASKLKIQIGVAFNVMALSDFQKQVKERIKANEGVLDFGNETMWGTSEDNLESWVDTRQKAIKALRAENKLYEKDDSDWAKEKIKNNNAEIEQNKNLLDLFHQSYEAEKKTKGGSKKKDVLGEALQKEVELIDNIQKRYKEYQKMGVDAQTAITKATDEYGNTLKNVGDVLSKYGIKTKTGEELAGMDLRGVRDYLQNLLNYAKALGNTKGIEAIEKSIAKINVEITKIDYKKITDGLNNELSKLKDEYELAIELDANPELGGIFADMMGISEEQLNDLPRNYEAVLKKLQAIIDSKLGSGRLDLSKNLSKAALDEWLKLNRQGTEQDDALAKMLNTFREYANKVRLDETKKQLESWDKLLEKYAEYEYKKEQIRKEYERETEIAIKKGASKDILDAITKRYNQQNAGLDFEEFKKSAQWIVATGDLAGMTHKALGMLIDDLTEYKKKAKNLDPKQIKEINRALKSLYKEQKKNNPFNAIADAIDEAKERMAEFQPEIDKTEAELRNLENNAKQENIAETAAKVMELNKKLKDLQEQQEEAGEIDIQVYTDWFNSIITLASKAADAIGEMMSALAGTNGSGDAKAVKDMFDILGNAGQWAAVGGLIGGAYGAIIGGVFGAVQSVITKFADEWSGNADITRLVERSERSVKRLEASYVDLEHAMEKAYGVAEVGAQKAIIYNKELQLVELKRQLQLEESRKSKNKDYDRILDLKKQIRELANEITDSVEDITNNMLGISSVGNAAETLVSNMISAFRNGEKYMDSYAETFEEMINNMIMKAIVSKVIGERIDELFASIQDRAKERAKKEEQAYKEALQEYESDRAFMDEWRGFIDEIYSFDPITGAVDRTKTITEEEWDALWQKRLEYLRKQYEDAITPTPQDVQNIRDDVQQWRSDVQSEFEAWMDAFGIKYGQDASKTLSSLQQGIQGVTEDTAGAIEAYMNGVSLQVYLQSDLLREIRDIVVGFDSEFQMATLGEILLQLRSSYEMQMAIHSLMDGWTTPSGNGIRVELMS